MTKYSTYKNKNLNESWNMYIPSEWKEVALRRYCKISSGSTPKGEPEFWNGEIDWVTPDDLGKNNKKTISETNRKITQEGYDSCGTELIPSNSVILSTRAPIGHTAIITKDMCFNQGCKGLTPNERVNSDFLYYLILASKEKLKILGNGTTFIELSRSAFASYKGIFPSIEEQTIIAQFLDEKTSQIDKLIEQKEKLLKLLTEKRSAIITEAVTKGLDPTVEMKDSEIDWLGEIPKHWKTKRFKFCLKETLKYGANEAAESSDPDQPRFVRITDVDENGKLRDETFRSIDAEIAKPFLLDEGDLLMARSGATVGKNFMYKSDWGVACFAGYLIRARLNQELILPEFGNLFLTSGAYWDWVNSIFIQSTIQNISAEKYANFVLAIPPKEEQHIIVAYAMNKREQLGNIIEGINTSLIKLKEYREALITSAVTGQIDIRKEVSHE